MAKGGKRPGAGRPVGSTNKVRFSDYISAEDKAEFIEFMLSVYKDDMRVATWIGDQLFGKASQAVEMTGNIGLTVSFDTSFDASTRKAKGNS